MFGSQQNFSKKISVDVPAVFIVFKYMKRLAWLHSIRKVFPHEEGINVSASVLIAPEMDNWR
jgi:hypothetical protein